MIKKEFDSRVKIYEIIESQLPSFVLDENPKVGEFLKQYYISQEFQGGPTDIGENLDQYSKINNILSSAVSNRSIYLTSDIGTDNKITINVNSTEGFPQKYGLLKIDDEIITYTGITTNSFLNCQRGFSGITNYHQEIREEELIFETSEASSHKASAIVINLSSLFLKELFKKIKYTFAPGFEEIDFNEKLNAGNFIKSIRSFYQSKGTEESFKILFKVLYGVNPTIVNLENFLLKPSTAEYLRREVVLIEQISGEPNNLVGQQIQKNGDPATNASVSNVEILTRNFKTYYKLSLFVGYDIPSAVQGSFKVTPNSKCTEAISIGSSIISVDSTIGFDKSGVLISGENTNITYSNKSINQFFGCSGIGTAIPFASDIRNDKIYFGYENGDLTKKVTFSILGSLAKFEQISEVLNGVAEGDAINIRSLGNPISKSRFLTKTFKEVFVNSWIYNANSRFDIDNFNGPKTLNLKSVILKDDQTSFKYGDAVEIVERGTNNIVFTSYIQEKIGENSKSIKLLGSFNPVEGVLYDLRRKLNKASSLYAPISGGNDAIISDISNLYTNTTEAYVASNSLPSSNRGLNIPYNYQITKKLDSFIISDSSGALESKVDINYSVIAFENPITFITGDRIYYQPDGDALVGLDPGYYFVEVISQDAKKIKLYASSSFIGTSSYILFRSPYNSGLGIHKFTLASQKSGLIGPQNLLRKFPLEINSNVTDDTSKVILPGPIGLLVNGVEIDSYKSQDKLYYGPLTSVSILNNGRDYDVINLPNISVLGGIGITALIQPVITGSINKVYVEPQDFDIDRIVSIGVNGGNGRGAVLEPILNLRVREVLFDGRATTVGGGINTTTGQLTFDTDHFFADGEEIFYNANGNEGIGVGIGTSTLIDSSSYYPKSTSPRTVLLYPSFKDYSIGINTIKFNIDNNAGVHKFNTRSNKKTLTEIKVISGGEGYTNRKLIVKQSGISTSNSTINFTNHGFSDGDLVVYSYETTPIIGISTDPFNKFYVLKLDQDSFRLCDAGSNEPLVSNYERKNYIKFKSTGTGYQYFSYPPISVSVEFTSVGIASTVQPSKVLSITPSVRGKIIDAYLYESGTGYGSTILNFEKKPIITIKNGKDAKVTPNISEGRINTVRLEYGGLEYYSIPDIIVTDPTGEGSGAEFLPIIENNRLKSVKVVNSGIGYSSTSKISIISAGSNALFNSEVRSLTLNNVGRYGSEHIVETLETDLKYSSIAYSEQLQNSFGDDGENHSHIIGWAYDGNPIYGAYGYTNPQDVNSQPKSLVSGYVLDSSYIDRPSNFSPGFFVEDYKYTENGDLDSNNGRFCKTPEFPLGTYAYFSPINSISLQSQFPYYIGNSFKSNVIEENLYLNQNIFDFSTSGVLRNTYPYKLTDPNVESDFLSSFADLKNQIVKVESVSTGNVDSYQIISDGDNYKIDDILRFKSDDGEDLSSRVSSLRGKDINNIVCDQDVYNDVILTQINPEKLQLTILPTHDLLDTEFISLTGFSTIFTKLDGTYQIGVSSITTTLAKDIPAAASIGSTEIYVSQIPAAISIGSSIGIGTEVAKVLNLYKIKNIVTIYRDTLGVAHTAKTQISLLPNSFTIDKNLGDEVDSKLNDKIYFNPKESIGVGTESGNGTSVSFNFADFTVSRDIPTRTIYLENHPFITNQKIRFTPPSGTISVSTDGTNTFGIPINGQYQDFYVVNKTINSIGLKTSFNSPELFFHSNGSNDDRYLLESTFDQITGSLTRFRTTVSVGSSHGLINGDIIKLNVKPNIDVGIGLIPPGPVGSGESTSIKVTFNENYQKLVLDPVGFGSTSITVSNFYYTKPTQQPSIGIYVGLGFTVGLGTTGQRNGQDVYDFIWNNYSKFDLDGDGVVSHSDALIATREMISVGFSGDALIEDIIFPGNATRRTASSIRSYINSLTSNVGIGSTTYDINGSGIVDASIDGELLKRFTNTDGLGKSGVYNPSSLRGSIRLSNHRFKTGDKVLYTSNDNGVLQPLDDGEYYVIKVDKDNIQLALTYKDCTVDPPNTVSIGFSGSESQSIGFINPEIKVTKNNTLNFDLLDLSLSGYDFKVYFDKSFEHEFISTGSTSTFSRYKVGNAGISTNAELKIIYDQHVPQKLYYALEKDGEIVNPDFDVQQKSTISYEDSLFIENEEYTVVGIASTYFNIFLKRLPERLSYASTECQTLEYNTSSKTAQGPIHQIEITSSKSDYTTVPVLQEIVTDNGIDANIILNSKVIGDIKEVSIINEGFSYESDITLKPSAYISPQIFIKDANTIKSISITKGGSGYSVAPNIVIVDVLNSEKIDTGILEARLSGSSVSSVVIIQKPKGIPDTEVKLAATNNTNGFSIQKIETYSSVVFDVYISKPTDGFVTAPFAPGDEVFIEGIQKNDAIAGDGFNSENYGYNFFKVVDLNTTGLLARVRVDASALTNAIGTPKTIQDFVPVIINRKIYPEFNITKEKLGFALNEKIFSNGVERDLKVTSFNNSYIKVFGSYELSVGEKIAGKQTGTIVTVSEIRENYGKFEIDYATKTNTGWANDIGKLNTDIQVISDNDYYQNLSYTIKSPITYDESKTVVNNFLHTIGTKNFSDTGITSTSNFGFTSEDSSITIKDIITEQRTETIYGFDLVKDINSFNGYSKFLQFDSKFLSPYINNKTNRVLKIDNVNTQFSNLESNINPYLDVVNLSTSNIQYLDALVRISNTDGSKVQLTDLVIVDNGTDAFLLEKGTLVNAGIGSTEYSGEKIGDFSLETKNSEVNLRFTPVDFANTDYDIKFIQKSFQTNTTGIASTSIGFITKFNSIQTTSGLTTTVGLTTNILSVDATVFKSLHASVHITDVVSNKMQYSELYVTHDNTNTFISEFYFDDFGADENGYTGGFIGSFGTNLNSDILSLNFENLYSQNDVIVKANIVGFGTTTIGISTYRFKTSGTPNGSERSAVYNSYSTDAISPNPLVVSTYNYTLFNSSKSLVEVSIGSTKAIHQVLTIHDGSSVYVKQLPFLSVSGISTSDSRLGLGTFGGEISGSNIILKFYPDNNITGKFNLSSFNKLLYTFVDAINIAPPLNYIDKTNFAFAKDSVIVKFYNSVNGIRINRRDFEMFYNELPIFAREFDTSDTNDLVLNTGTFTSPKHFFNENEELIYTPKSTIIGVGTVPLTYKSGIATGILPSTVYIVNKDDDTFQISTTKSGTAVTFTSSGGGNAHVFEMKKKNEKCILTIDDVIQYPIFPKQIYYQLTNSIGVAQSTFQMTGISTIVPKDVLKINNEYMGVVSVGFGTTSIGPIIGVGTFPLVTVTRGYLGTAATSYSSSSQVSVNIGAFNIVQNKLYFTDPPRGNVQEVKDQSNLDSIKSDFTGRVFLRNDYTTNIIYDDISTQFNGIGRTFTLTVGSANTVGLGTSGGNGLLLINGMFQTPTTSNNPKNNFALRENAGITSVVFSGIRPGGGAEVDTVSDYDINQNDRPRGGLIVSIGSTLGIGYAPLVGARVKPIVSAAGTITSVVGTSYTGNSVSVSTASYNNFSGIIQITTTHPHKLLESDLVRLVGLGFTCPSNVGVVSFFPRSTASRLDTFFPIVSVASSTVFTAKVGTSTLPHTYIGFGTVFPWYNLNIGSGYRGPVSVAITQSGHNGTVASITANVGAGGTLSFTVNSGGSGYSTITPCNVSIPDPSYANLPIEGVSRIGIGSTTTTGVGLILSLDVDSNPYYAGGKFYDAANLISRNLQLIADVAVGRMLDAYPGFTIPGGNSQCSDDIKAVLETIIYNLRFGGNDRVYEAADIYRTQQSLLSGEEVQSIYAFNQARDIAIQVMRNEVVNTGGYTTEVQVIDNTVIGDASNTPGEYTVGDCADVASSIGSFVGIVTNTINNVIISGAGATIPANKTVAPGSLFSVKNFTITRPGYSFRKGDVIRPVGLVTDARLNTPLSNFELTVLDTFTDSFALWQFGNLDYIDSIAAYQDGYRLSFPLYYNGQLLSFEKDKNFDLDMKNLLVIFVNGILQEPDKSYQFDGGTTFVFTSAPKPEDNIAIFFYRGTIGSDSALNSDIAQTIKTGDNVQVIKNNGYDTTISQNERLVQNVTFADRIETDLYTGPGIDEVNLKPINWTKQKRDKIVFGQTVYKVRDSIESQVYPTAKLISGITTISKEFFVDNASFFNYNNQIAAKPFDLLIVGSSSTVGMATTAPSPFETIKNITTVNGFCGVVTGIGTTTGIGTSKALKFFLNNLDSDTFVTAGLSTGYPIYIYDTRVGSGITAISNSNNNRVGIGSTYLDCVYYVSAWSGVVGDDNAGIITCNVHSDSNIIGLSSSGTEIKPVGKFSWGRLYGAGVVRSTNPISIAVTTNTVDVGLTTYPTIQRRAIGLKLIYATGALPKRLT